MVRRKRAVSNPDVAGQIGTMVSELQGPAMATATTKIDGEIESSRNLDYGFRSKVGSKNQTARSSTDYGVELHKLFDLEWLSIVESRHQRRRSEIRHNGFVDGGGGYSSPRPSPRHLISYQVFDQEVDQELEERLEQLELKLDRLFQDSHCIHQSRRSKERGKFKDSGGSWQTPTARRNACEKSTSTKKSPVGYLPPHLRHNASSIFYEKFPSPTRSQSRYLPPHLRQKVSLSPFLTHSNYLVKEFTSNVKMQSVSRIWERPPSVRLNSFKKSALSKNVLEGGSDDMKSQKDGHGILKTHIVEDHSNSTQSGDEKTFKSTNQGGLGSKARASKEKKMLMFKSSGGRLFIPSSTSFFSLPSKAFVLSK